jgi:hypothetical protein
MKQTECISKVDMNKHLREMRDAKVGELSPENAGKFAFFLDRLRRNTNGELTETEYDHLARMELFLDTYETYMKERGIGNVDSMLIDTARKYSEKIISVLQKHREGNDQPTPFLEGLKMLSAKYDKDKVLVEMEFAGEKE